MTIYTTRDTATQASLGRLRELVLVWVLVGARALLHQKQKEGRWYPDFA